MSDNPLSGKEMISLTKSLTGYEPNMISYSDLKNYESIDDVLKNDMCIILYESMPGYGHWTCIFKDPINNEIEHFDSYGYTPDKELSFVPKKINNQLGQGFPLLSKLLVNSPYDIRYNHFKFQGKDSSTCGKWCILRLFLRSLNEYQFKKILGNMTDKDIIKIFELLL